MTENSVYLFIRKLIIYIRSDWLECVQLVASYNHLTKLLFTGVIIMTTTDSSMKKTMSFLMAALFSIFLSIILLAKYVAQ